MIELPNEILLYHVYETLFDFDTEVWKEGPDYLMMLFKEELDKG